MKISKLLQLGFCLMWLCKVGNIFLENIIARIQASFLSMRKNKTETNMSMSL